MTAIPDATRVNFTPFMSKSFQIWDQFFPLLFPKDSKNLKSLNIVLREVGAHKLFKQVRKCDGQTNIRTFGLTEKIGPDGWFFENIAMSNIFHLPPWSALYLLGGFFILVSVQEYFLLTLEKILGACLQDNQANSFYNQICQK